MRKLFLGRINNNIEMNQTQDYLSELRNKFTEIKFERIEKIDGIYVTNPINQSTNNDFRIYKETQIKRTLRSPLSPFVSQMVKSKLNYFSQEEDKDPNKIYHLDNVEELQEEENYSIQNIGHATQLIQLPSCTILTDPVFNNLNVVFYPEKTASHPNIENLPKIDVILISHNHRDHVDFESLKKLLKYQKNEKLSEPKIFVPLGDKEFFEHFELNEIVEVDWFMRISVGPVYFISIPADHRSGRNGYDHHKSLVIGWIINPVHENVIIKYSGDTRSLSNQNQQVVDAILWNEIKCKSNNLVKNDEDVEISEIICLEPSGPNYTRCDMDKTHQSTSYSALLKFIQAKNLAHFSNRTIQEFLDNISTVMMHHNKYELGPDRFNEGLFITKKLLNYLDLDEENLNRELYKQKEKLELRLDRKELLDCTPFTSKLMIYSLPEHTSLLVRAKDFIIEDIQQIKQKIDELDRKQIRDYVIKNTVFPKIGERFNSNKLKTSTFDADSIQKYYTHCNKTK